MGQGTSSSAKTTAQPGPPKKRKSVIEKVAGTVKKFTTRKKKNEGDEPIKNLEDAGNCSDFVEMGNVCTNSSATAVGAPHPDELTRPKKKRSMVGNMVHNVKKKMSPKPKWNDSKPEPDKVRKNHRELDDNVEKKHQRPKPRQPKPKAYNLSDGVPDDFGYGGFAPEAGVFGHGGDGGGHGGDGGDGGDGGF